MKSSLKKNCRLQASRYARRATEAGFTLIEALLAMAIFAFMGVSAYGILNNIQRAQEHALQNSEQMAQLQKVSWQIAKDFRHMVVRPIVDENGNALSAIEHESNDYLFEFTRSAWANPLGWPRSSLQRVAYSIDYHPKSQDSDSPFYEDETLYLIRYYWQVLDRGYDSEPLKQVMLADVEDFFVRFYDPADPDDPWKTNPVVRTYSPPGGGGSGAFNLPYAVEVNIGLDEDNFHSFVLPVISGGNS